MNLTLEENTKFIAESVHLFLYDHVPEVPEGLRFWSLGSQEDLATVREDNPAGIHIAGLRPAEEGRGQADVVIVVCN